MKNYVIIGVFMLWTQIGLYVHTLAQCGSFGDPLINITFGNAANPMTQLSTGETDYILHNGVGFMNPNYYMITDNAINGAGGYDTAYHYLTDHTGDSLGGMLLVNASTEPGIFYTSIQHGLCPNTEFNFSAWVVNVSPDSMGTCGVAYPINVEFEIQTISGEQLAIMRTNEIDGTTWGETPAWQEFSVSFNTGNYTEVILIIRNVGPGGCGNNLAIDDIQFRPCGPSVTFDANIGAIDGDSILLCSDIDELTFQGTIGVGYDSPTYQWQQRSIGDVAWQDIYGANNLSYTLVRPTRSTWFRLAVAAEIANLDNEKCRVVSDSIRVIPVDIPAVDPIPETINVCVGNEAVMNVNIDFHEVEVGHLSYQWYVEEEGDWVRIPEENGRILGTRIDLEGIYRYQYRATNHCDIEFLIKEYQVVVSSYLEATLSLDLDVFCMNVDRVTLVGGTFVGVDNLDGIYSGPGVIDGVFHPQVAGVGVHTITYSPPGGVMCGNPATATITVLDSVFLEDMDDIRILPGQQIRLNPSSNATTYTWDPHPTLDRYDVRDPVASPNATTTYRLVAANDAGCQTEGFVTVAVLADLIIPNSFSPNGDGVNDVWEIEGLDSYPNVTVQVFNRWGALVFSSNGYATPWGGQLNGVILPTATYYYVISSAVFDKPLNGGVTILR